jgi:hypothetical protein
MLWWRMVSSTTIVGVSIVSVGATIPWTGGAKVAVMACLLGSEQGPAGWLVRDLRPAGPRVTARYYRKPSRIAVPHLSGDGVAMTVV